MSLRISQRQKRGGLRNEGKGVGMTEGEIEIAALSSKARNDGIITPTLILPPQGGGKYDGTTLLAQGRGKYARNDFKNLANR